MATLSLIEIAGDNCEVYDGFYSLLDPNNIGSIAAIEAARFLKKSDLSDIVLSRIWDIADYQHLGCLDKKGLFIALKLIALAQAGKDIQVENLKIEMPPPKLSDVVLPKSKPKSSMSNNSLTTNLMGDWSIKPAERSRYDRLFNELKPIDGYLSGDKVREALMGSKLPVKTLSRIWDLADIDKDGKLSHHEFIIAMHLVYKALEKHAIPSVLPAELQLLTSAMKPNEQFNPTSSVSSSHINLSRNTSRKSSLILDDFNSLSINEKLANSTNNNNNWVLTPSDLIKYNSIFKESDLDKDGFVSGNEVRGIFLRSGLSQDILAKIWALADINECGKLNSEQFALSMWLIDRYSKGFGIPNSLSSEMIPPSFRHIENQILKLSSPSIEMMKDNMQPEVVAPLNPEIDMLNNEIREKLKEKANLENEFQLKEADFKIKKGEYVSLQGELNTLIATLKQLENQQGEAQKRLNDLKSQVEKLRTQSNEQAELIATQEKELNAKTEELNLIRDKEQQLEMKRFVSEQKSNDFIQKLQDSQLSISQIKTKKLQLEEYQIQLQNNIDLFENALETNDFYIMQESMLQIEPYFRQFGFSDNDDGNLKESLSLQNGDSSNFQENAFSNNNDFFKSDDPFNDKFDNATDAFNDPFNDQKNSNIVKSNEQTDNSFESDPFAILHAPPKRTTTTTNDLISASENNTSSNPELPPKKGKSAPPRPAPPKTLLNKNINQKPVSDHGFADFDDFDTKFATATKNSSNLTNNNYNDAFSTTISSNSNITTTFATFPTDISNHYDNSQRSKSDLLKVQQSAQLELVQQQKQQQQTTNSSNSFYDNFKNINLNNFRYEDPFAFNDPFLDDEDNDKVKTKLENAFKFDNTNQKQHGNSFFDKSNVNAVSSNSRNDNAKQFDDSFNNNYQF